MSNSGLQSLNVMRQPGCQSKGLSTIAVPGLMHTIILKLLKTWCGLMDSPMVIPFKTVPILQDIEVCRTEYFAMKLCN